MVSMNAAGNDAVQVGFTVTVEDADAPVLTALLTQNRRYRCLGGDRLP